MPKLTEARSSAMEYDGAAIIIHNSGVLNLVDPVAEQAGFLVPFAATIKEVRSRVRVACGTGPGLAQLKGVEKGGTAYAEQSHAITDAAGTDLVWPIADAVVPAGEVLYFAGDGGATGTGSCDVTVVLVPAQA